MRVQEIAELLGSDVEGDGSRSVTSGATPQDAGPEDLAFVESLKGIEAVAASKAGCLIVPQDCPEGLGPTLIRADEPRTAFARVLRTLCPPDRPSAGIDATARVDPAATLGEGVSIGPHVIIEADVCLGDGVAVGPGCTDT